MIPTITKMEVYPVAGKDCMELNLSGAHAPYFTRNIVILHADNGEVGVGEVPGGQKIKFWDDQRIYLGNQMCKHDGSGRCYGLTADEHHLLVCEYGDNGCDPEIVVYKRRDG